MTDVRVLVLTAMYPTSERPVFGTFVQEQVESLRRSGIDVEVFYFAGSRSLRNYLRAGQALRRKLREHEYDAIHGHYGLVALPALMQRRCPVVITYHGSDLLGEVDARGAYTLSGRLKVLLCKVLGLFVAERIIVAERIRTRWWRATTIPMGVDMDLFQPRDRTEARRKLGLDPDRRTVLFLANPANRIKRYDLAEAAMEVVRSKDPQVDLLPVYQVPHAQIPTYMNACDVLLLTSDHEASPCVIKEALASNLGIVSVSCGDVPERLRGVNGSYLAERTPADLAARIIAALSYAGPRNGREIVAPLSLENTARATIGVYERATGKAARR